MDQDNRMDASDPYQAPRAAVEDPPGAADAPLFRISAIGLATVLGSVLAGGWLIAMNYAALGRPAQARKARWFSLLALIAVLALSMLVPEQVPSAVFVVVQVLGTVHLARALQGEAIAARAASGRPMRSNWLAAGISLVFLVLLLVLLVGAAMLLALWPGEALDGSGL